MEERSVRLIENTDLDHLRKTVRFRFKCSWWHVHEKDMGISAESNVVWHVVLSRTYRDSFDSTYAQIYVRAYANELKFRWLYPRAWIDGIITEFDDFMRRPK